MNTKLKYSALALCISVFSTPLLAANDAAAEAAAAKAEAKAAADAAKAEAAAAKADAAAAKAAAAADKGDGWKALKHENEYLEETNKSDF